MPLAKPAGVSRSVQGQGCVRSTIQVLPISHPDLSSSSAYSESSIIRSSSMIDATCMPGVRPLVDQFPLGFNREFSPNFLR